MKARGLSLLLAAAIICLSLEAKAQPAAEAPAAQDDVPRIQQPQWLRIPGDEELRRAFPRSAHGKARTGRAVIRCTITEEGTLSECRVLSEDPAGLGSGDAALSLAGRFKMRPKAPDGRPVTDGVVMIPIRFSLD